VRVRVRACMLGGEVREKGAVRGPSKRVSKALRVLGSSCCSHIGDGVCYLKSKAIPSSS